MPVFGNVKIKLVIFVATLLFIGSVGRCPAAQTVKLPITIDYSLLQLLIQRNAYTGPDQTAILVNKDNGCLFLSLSRPAVSESNGLLRFETKVTARVGTPVGDKCMVPLTWQGYLVLLQRPVVDGATWKLSFQTTASAVLDAGRRPARIVGVIWDLIKSHVYSYLEGISIDLGPPVNDLKSFLLPLFPPSVQQQTQTMLKTLRSGETRVTPKAVVTDLLVDVQEVYKPGETHEREVLSGKDLEDMVGVWEQWDAMLSYLVASMGKDVLTDEERQTLMDVLLETRYAFVEGLSSQNLTQDFVREQFVRAWRRLSPIFRNHAGRNPDEKSLGYLSFFTAADALSVLDSLGPTFGIEISRDGLIRLARMLTSDQSILNYTPAVNTDLRKVFQLMPSLPVDTQPENTSEPPAVPEGPKPDAKSPVETRIIGGPGSAKGIEEHDLPNDLDQNAVLKTVPETPVVQPKKPENADTHPNGILPVQGGKGKEQNPAVPEGKNTGNDNQKLQEIINNLKKEDQKPAAGEAQKTLPENQVEPSGKPSGVVAQPGSTKPDVRDGEKKESNSQDDIRLKDIINDLKKEERQATPDDIKKSTPPPADNGIDSVDPFDLPDQEQVPEKQSDKPPADGKSDQSSVLRNPAGAMAKIWDFLFPPAFAGDLDKYEIERWKIPDSGIEQYVKEVESVLNAASQTMIKKGDIPSVHQEMFRSLIIAMAWQESCFRQFVEKNHQLTYLLSYNNTSVGLMQVNERVWRGLYDRDRLRWDIHYNAAAGSEISLLYLQKYALRDKRVAGRLDEATIARLVYAMYNGGPGQYQDFLERLRKGKTWSSDDLFKEKYNWVISGNRGKINQCLSGN